MNEDRKPTKSQLPHEVPAGQETAVPKGMIPAVGVIPHPDQDTYPGVLVMARNHDEVVSWHRKDCDRKGIRPEAILFDSKGAPWCPSCFKQNLFENPLWDEQWKSVPGASNYEASTGGRIRKLNGDVLSPYVDPKYGYQRTSLRLDSGKRIDIRVHQIIASTWLGECPDGMIVCHGKQGVSVNAVHNLRYAAHRENTLDSVKDGTHVNSRKTHCKNGHEFTKENTRIRSNGSRKCKTCERNIGRNRSRKPEITMNPPEKFGD